MLETLTCGSVATVGSTVAVGAAVVVGTTGVSDVESELATAESVTAGEVGKSVGAALSE